MPLKLDETRKTVSIGSSKCSKTSELQQKHVNTSHKRVEVMEGAKAGDLGRALQRAKQAGAPPEQLVSCPILPPSQLVGASQLQEGHKGLGENVVRLLIQQALDALAAWRRFLIHVQAGKNFEALIL